MKTTPPTPRARKKLLAAASLLACAWFVSYALVSRPASARQDDAQEGARPAQTGRKGEEEPRVTVYGRAVYEGTNRPVRRAQVMLVGDTTAGGGEHTALTDADGRFRVRGVPPGRFFAFVNMSGVLSPVSFLALDELRGGAAGLYRPELKSFFDEVEVDGKADKEVTVYARRGAAVSGKVTYPNGDPAVNVRVHLMRHRDKRLTRFLPGVSPAALFDMVTDDRGVYRISGLPPGEYVVGVAETADHNDEGPRGGMSEYLDAYLFQAVAGEPLLMTYHPSATRAADAAVIKVEAGDERDDVDVTIAERDLRELSGVVRGRRDRRPVRNVGVFLVRKQEGVSAAASYFAEVGEMAYPSVKTDAEGRWRLKDIPDGQYTLHFAPAEEYEGGEGASMNMNMNFNGPVTTTTMTNTNSPPYTPPRRRRKYASARRELRVGPDTQELTTELSDGGRITGSVTVEDGKPLQYSGIILAPVEPNPVRPAYEQMPSVAVYAGEFTVEGVAAGSYHLYSHAMTADRTSYLYVKSITWNGRDLLREPLEVAEGANIEGVRVVYARDPARLRVRVLARDDRRPVRGAFVFLVPPDAAGRPDFARTPQCTTGEEGWCEIPAAPGDYAVVALPVMRERPPADFEADLVRRAATAPRLTLRAAETRTYELNLAGGN